ncbi:MAG: type II toxin-antitoxin system HicA family toxin [Synergistaceae bacterium]|nr:type II toxin-antitoxin system HicA family toxin [Synergistaceae bacterium]
MPPVIKILFDVLSGVKDNNIAFSDLQKLLTALGFQHRTRGSHFIYWKAGVEEIINIQPDGNKAKSYQVKQIRNVILKYKLSI